MSKPANTTTQSKSAVASNNPPLVKSAWARGPPTAAANNNNNASSRSQSPNGSTTPVNTTPSHSRKPSSLGPGSSAVPLKDGVSVSKGINTSGHRPCKSSPTFSTNSFTTIFTYFSLIRAQILAPSINFGSIDSNPTPPVISQQNGTPTADSPQQQPPVKSFGQVNNPPPTPSAKSTASTFTTPPVSSTSSPTPSSVSAATSSVPSTAPTKKKLDIHKMFQTTSQPSAFTPPSNTNANPISPAVASPQQRTSALPPPAQHAHSNYFPPNQPHLRSQSQTVPRSPQLSRGYTNGTLPPGPNPSTIPNRGQAGPPIPQGGPGVPAVGSPRVAHQQPLHQPPPPPIHQPPQAQPSQMPMHMPAQWGQFYVSNFFLWF
jgi:hypothetical protein